jgi:pyruvate formate lyase activating enzyme
MTGVVFDIQRFSTHDGPGIRTTVFLKGCSLRCAWCHNPESQEHAPALSFAPELCLACGGCERACPSGAHALVEDGHRLDRSLCRRCFLCADACPTPALERVGALRTVEEVMAEVQADRVFYDCTGGGLTVSGGEPMAQADFAQELLAAGRKAGIHTCMETSGAGAPADYERVAPVCDLFLWDVKDTDEARHTAYTGAPLEPLLANLRRVDGLEGAIILRCLLVGGVNTCMEHAAGIARIYAQLRHCEGVELLEYHPLGEGKRARFGLPQAQAGLRPPTEEEAAEVAETLRRDGIPVSIVSR